MMKNSSFTIVKSPPRAKAAAHSTAASSSSSSRGDPTERLLPWRPLLVNSQSPLRARYRVPLTYHTVVTPSLTANLASDYEFNLNSAYDPDRTGTGHQPYGFDQMATLYNRYVVRSVKYQATLAASAGTFGQLTVVPSNSTTTFGTSETDLAAEYPLAQSVYSVSGVPGPGQVVAGVVDLWKLNGVSLESYLAADRFQSLVTTSPGEFMVLHCVATNSATTATNFVYSLKLVFDVEFFDPIGLGGS